MEQQLQDEELRSKQLEEQLGIEKKKIDQQALNKQQQLSQEVAKLQTLLQNEKTAKVEQEKYSKKDWKNLGIILNWINLKLKLLK